MVEIEPQSRIIQTKSSRADTPIPPGAPTSAVEEVLVVVAADVGVLDGGPGAAEGAEVGRPVGEPGRLLQHGEPAGGRRTVEGGVLGPRRPRPRPPPPAAARSQVQRTVPLAANLVTEKRAAGNRVRIC